MKNLLILSILLILITLIYLNNPASKIPPSLVNNHVIGKLGGVPSLIPASFAHFVEYDGDPNFMERKGWVRPERTYESSIRSFGFEVRYPDMASIEIQTKSEKNIRTTKWMRVGINSGEHYGSSGDQALNNYKKRYLDQHKPCTVKKCFIYVAIENTTHGLIAYTPIGSGVDVEKRSIDFGRGTDRRDRNIYFELSSKGDVTTFIKCSNRTHAAVRCEHSFDMSPNMIARVRINYRKDLLPHWRDIQDRVRNLILNFGVSENINVDQ